MTKLILITIFILFVAMAVLGKHFGPNIIEEPRVKTCLIEASQYKQRLLKYTQSLLSPISHTPLLEDASSKDLDILKFKKAWKRTENFRITKDADGSKYSCQTLKAFIQKAFNPEVSSNTSFHQFSNAEVKKKPSEISGNKSLLRYATTVLNTERSPAASCFVNYHAFPLEELAECLKNVSPPEAAIILLDGEPNPLSETSKHCDLIFTTKKEEELVSKGIYYVPYFIFWMMEIGEGCFTKPESFCEAFRPGGNPLPRQRQVDFVYGNCNEIQFEGVKQRRQISEAFDKICPVSKLGICGNEKFKQLTSPEKLEHVENSRTFYLSNHLLYRNTKFVIAVENTFALGYITEKITAPLLAGAIPIYLGAPDITSYFNSECFINVRDFEGDYDALAQYVTNLTDDRFEKMVRAPRLAKNFDFSHSTFGSIFTGGSFYSSILAERLLQNQKHTGFAALRGSMFFEADVVFAIPMNSDTESETQLALRSGFCKRTETCNHPSEISQLSSEKDLVLWTEPWGVSKIREISQQQTQILELLFKVSTTSLNSGNCSTTSWRSWQVVFYAARRDFVEKISKSQNPVDLEILG
jgi:hypothetical protein